MTDAPPTLPHPPANDSDPPASGLAHERARRVLPGGLGRSTFLVGAPAPYLERGEGCRVWDLEGRELVDLNNNFTALIHGHAQPDIVRAAQAAIESGASFGLPNLRELEHAELLTARLPHAEIVRYTNSGTEAVMTALRLARAHTGREACVIVRRAYHGTSDPVLPAGGDAATRGVPDAVVRHTLLVDVNDVDGLRDAVEQAHGNVAAMLIDLLPNRSGLVAATPEFVQAAGELCDRHGILMICDEVISYRMRPEGHAENYGLVPDLTVLGKLIGGGLPVGAVAGRETIMREFDPMGRRPLEHGGTFSGNPVTMAAGRVAMELFDAAESARLNALGDQLREAVARRVAGLGWEVRGTGSLLRPFPGDAVAERQRALWWAAYERGMLLNPTGLIALSTPMDVGVIEEVAEQLVAAIEAVANGWRPAHATNAGDADGPA